MKNKFVILTIATLVISGCATTTIKNYSASGGSRSDGTIKLSYEYGLFETPQVNEQEGIELAKKRCASWGYNNAEEFGGVNKVCTDLNDYGCKKWLVTKEYQCLGSLEK